MGCTSTKQQAQAPAQQDKPKPQVFAIMRNGHEVLRGCLRDMVLALEQADKAEFYRLWTDFLRWHAVHAAMEDGVPGKAEGMFAFLNREANNVATDEGLHEEHKKVEEKQAALQQAVGESTQMEGLRALFTSFAETYESHLKVEEGIMMSKVADLTKSGYDMKGAMRTWLMPCVADEELKFFLSFAVRVLEKHSEGQPRARVFAHAVWAVSSVEEWPARHEAIKEGLSAELYNKTKEECGF